MKRLFTIMTVAGLVFFTGTFVSAEKNLYVELDVPDAVSGAGAGAPGFSIQSVTDARSFGGPESAVDVPSWGVEDPKEQTEELRRRAVGRAVARGGKKEGNILLGKGDVESVMKAAVSTALVNAGYRMIGAQEEPSPDTIMVAVEVRRFWGHFQEAFIGGDIAVTIEAAVALHRKDRIEKKVIEVSGKKSARYPQKPENWQPVFNTALADFVNTAAREMGR